MFAILDHVEDIAAGIKTFWFKPEQRVRYTAGQFTELYLPHENPDERGEKRWFTLSSSPTEPLLSITTKFAAGRSSTFKKTLRALPVGARVHLAEPMGDFVLPKDKAIPLLFVAAGIGITPGRSMIKYLLDTNERRTIHLLYGAGRPDALAFQGLFEAYTPLRFTPVVREADAGWKGESGSLNVPRIMLALQDSSDTLVYLSGPEHTVETLDKGLKAAGVPNDHIVTDFFHGYRQI